MRRVGILFLVFLTACGMSDPEERILDTSDAESLEESQAKIFAQLDSVERGMEYTEGYVAVLSYYAWEEGLDFSNKMVITESALKALEGLNVPEVIDLGKRLRVKQKEEENLEFINSFKTEEERARARAIVYGSSEESAD
jgi:hypothetical protein